MLVLKFRIIPKDGDNEHDWIFYDITQNGAFVESGSARLDKPEKEVLADITHNYEAKGHKFKIVFDLGMNFDFNDIE